MINKAEGSPEQLEQSENLSRANQGYTNTIYRQDPITTYQDSSSMENVTDKEATNQNYQHSNDQNEKQPRDRRKKKRRRKMIREQTLKDI